MRGVVSEKRLKEATWPLPSAVTRHSGCRWRGTSPRFTGRHKGIFHKHWHTHQLPGCLSRQGPLWSPACVVSVLSPALRIAWLQPPPARPMWPVWQLRPCADTRSLFRSRISVHSRGSDLDLMQALRHICIYLVVYLVWQFLAVTHSAASTRAPGTCVCSLPYTCMHANCSKYAYTLTWIPLCYNAVN